MTLQKEQIRLLLLLLAAFCFGSFFRIQAFADSDQNPHPDDAPNISNNIAYHQILPKDKILKFHQVNFKFDFGHLEDSDWGQLEVFPKMLEKYSGGCSGFINVFVKSSSQPEAQRVVADLYIPPTNENNMCSTEDPQLRKQRDDTGESQQAQSQEIPFTRFFDLSPEEEGDGPLQEIEVIALFSRQPQAHPIETIVFDYQIIEPKQFDIEPTPYNAQGGFAYFMDDDPIPPPVPNPDDLVNFGPPPVTVAIPIDVDDLSFPIEVMQGGYPNLNSAVNECFPVAIANVLGALERSYDSEDILNWELEHARSVKGIGKVNSSGDVIFWQPVPEYSLAANVDFYARRQGVMDFETGEGSNSCQFFYALFGYLANHGVHSPVEFRHQDGLATIDPNSIPGCTPPPFSVGPEGSTQEGSNVTWDWIYEQLSKGRGVMVGVTYNSNGEAVGGHAMRVRGVSRINGRDYLTFVNDSDQGDNLFGLEYPTFEVSDIRGPVLKIVPNGLLELDRGQNEINFAISFEAKPTLAIF